MKSITFNRLSARPNAIAAGLLAIAAIAGVAMPVHAGAEGGPILKRDRVSASSQRVYTLRCNANAWTTLAMVGDGDTDLDIFVYDAAGNLVASDINLTDRAVVRWYSLERQSYTVIVMNHGNVYNDFVLASD